MMPLRWAVVVPITLLAAFVAVRSIDWSAYVFLVREDGPVEWLQALLYLLAALCAWRLGYHYLRSGAPVAPGWMFLLLGAVLAVVAAEEISWGQRILGIGTPEPIRIRNSQNELNVHNLEPVQRILHEAYMAAGLYGMFSHLIPRALLDRWSFARRFRLDLLIVPRRYFFFFLPVFAFYFGSEFLPDDGSSPWLHWRDQEPAELFLALGSLVFMYGRMKTGSGGGDGPLPAGREVSLAGGNGPP